MSQRRITQVKVGLSIIAITFAAAVMIVRTAPVTATTDAYSFFDPIVDLRREIVTRYVKEPDQEEMMTGAIEGMIETLDDPYTSYFSPEALKSFEKQTQGSFSGIGAEISTRDGQLEIVTPLEDSPAFKAGIMAGDIILEIDGESTEGVNVMEAVERITGPEGTPVKLKVRHPSGKEQVITIIRQRIEIQTVKGFKRDKEHHWDYTLDEDAKIGYIRMTQFSAPTHEAMKEALAELKEEGMEGLILDLRFNPGGLLDAAVNIADLFLEDGVIVSTKGRTTEDRAWSAKKDPTDVDFPIIVLVNEASASASEILAGAIKDNDRGVVLGTRTVGKGSVQQIVPLEGGNSGALKLTTSLYYLPSGRNIHKLEGAEQWGVDPNDGFYVSMTDEQIRSMLEVRRAGDILRNGNGDDADAADSTDADTDAPGEGEEEAVKAPKFTGDISPEWIQKNLKDEQLAAALTAMRAKLEAGEWKKVGGDNATVLAHLNQRERLRRQRSAIMDRLNEIDQELKDLDQKIAKNGGVEIEGAADADDPVTSGEELVEKQDESPMVDNEKDPEGMPAEKAPVE